MTMRLRFISSYTFLILTGALLSVGHSLSDTTVITFDKAGGYNIQDIPYWDIVSEWNSIVSPQEKRALTLIVTSLAFTGVCTLTAKALSKFPEKAWTKRAREYLNKAAIAVLLSLGLGGIVMLLKDEYLGYTPLVIRDDAGKEHRFKVRVHTTERPVRPPTP